MPTVTVGVEEEFLLLDPRSGSVRADAPAVLAAARPRLGDSAQPELMRMQVETATPVLGQLGEVGIEVSRLRAELAAAAEQAGCVLAATATPVLGALDASAVSATPRYQELKRRYPGLIDHQGVCGNHVHVAVPHPDAGAQALSFVRPWLPVLLALSANSPFYDGRDTGWASYRTAIWSRWPTAGPPPAVDSYATYRAALQKAIDSGQALDEAAVYWNVRLSERYPTMELRVCDVPATVDEAVLQAGLARALVVTAVEAVQAGAQPPQFAGAVQTQSYELAARNGVEGRLVDPVTAEVAGARSVVGRLLEHVRPALEAAGDIEQVTELLTRVLDDGSAAARQRAAFARRGELRDVVDHVVAETARSALGGNP